jgi:hypothetical protein
VSFFYTNPRRAAETHSLPDAETFKLDQVACDVLNDEDPDEPYEPGWYARACFPGCLPDNEFMLGPYKSERAAIAAWREEFPDDDTE